MKSAPGANRLFLFLAFMVTHAFVVGSTQAQSTAKIWEGVRDAWQKRQDGVESATFNIRCTLVLTENELQRRAHRLETLHGQESGLNDSHQSGVILTELHELAFDGDKMRYSMTFDESTHEIAKLVNRNMTLLCVTNGTDYRLLESFPDDGQVSGVIQNAEQFPAFRLADISPVMQTFRPFAEYRQQLTPNLTVVESDEPVEDRSVVILKPQHDVSRSTGMQYWTDTSREYVVVRDMAIVGDGQIGYQVDIEYEQDDSGYWVPIKWQRSIFDSDGELRRSSEFEVVAYEINPQLPASLFELSFDPGVQVYDKRNGVRQRNVWTVNADGTKNMLRGVDPDKPNPLAAPRGGWPLTLFWVNLLVVLCLVMFVILRRRHRRSS